MKARPSVATTTIAPRGRVRGRVRGRGRASGRVGLGVGLGVGLVRGRARGHRTAVDGDHGVAGDQRHDDARGAFVQQDARSQPDDQNRAERAEHLQGRCGEM